MHIDTDNTVYDVISAKLKPYQSFQFFPVGLQTMSTRSQEIVHSPFLYFVVPFFERYWLIRAGKLCVTASDRWCLHANRILKVIRDFADNTLHTHFADIAIVAHIVKIQRKMYCVFEYYMYLMVIHSSSRDRSVCVNLSTDRNRFPTTLQANPARSSTRAMTGCSS